MRQYRPVTKLSRTEKTHIFYHLLVVPQTSGLHHGLQHVCIVPLLLSAIQRPTPRLYVFSYDAACSGAFPGDFAHGLERQPSFEGEVRDDPSLNVAGNAGAHGRAEDFVEGGCTRAEVVEVDAHGLDTPNIEDGLPQLSFDYDIRSVPGSVRLVGWLIGGGGTYL